MSEKFGEQFYEVEPGLVVDEDGVIVECDIDSPLLFLAQRRHEAHTQMKAHEAYRQVIDRVLLKQQAEKTQAYGDVVISVKSRTYTSFEGEAFADLLYEAFGTSEPQLLVSRLLHIVAAATAFRTAPDKDRPELPYLDEEAAELLERVKEKHMTKPWIESSVARKPARVARVVPDPELVEA